MTIIEPHKTKFKTNELLSTSVLFLFLSTAWIFVYNLNVDLKYNVSMKEKESQNLESLNADLRNDLYQKLDIRNLDKFIEARNLVQDKAPDYVENRVLANR